MVLNGPQRHQIGRIGQHIDIQNSGIQLADQQPASRRTDKPRATRNQHLHRDRFPVSRSTSQPAKQMAHNESTVEDRPVPDASDPYLTISLGPRSAAR